MLPPPVTQRHRRAAGQGEPTGLVPALVLLGFGLTALCGVAALLLLGRLPAPALLPEVPVPTATSAPTRTPVPGLIEGGVWADACDANAPATPACVLDNTGRYRANGTWDASEPGLEGVLVTLGLGECPAVPVLSVLTGAGGRYRFGGLPAGRYCVSVDPAHNENVTLVPGGWTWPAPGAAVAAQVAVQLQTGQTATLNFGWDPHEESPTSQPPPATATGLPSPTPGCSDHAAFMADVTIPDQAVLAPGAPFTKTWRVLNTGSCAWGEGYALLFNSGEALGSPGSVPLTTSVPPGSLLDLSLSLTAPVTLGPHEGSWVLRGLPERGSEPFGTGPDGEVPLRVRIIVAAPTATPSPTPSAWQASYFANRDLAGQPALIRAEAAVNFDWGLGAPGPNVPADEFSARWTGNPVFEDGTYRLILTIDDGARLWVDNELVIDEWRDASRREVAVERPLLAGAHQFRLEYYDHSYEAVAMLRWERVGPYPYWNGEYWANPNLSGAPAFTRQDGRLDFAWGTGAPGPGVPADNFSARWTRASHFDAGAYRFRVTVDDGVRLWVDDQLIIDAWAGGPTREVTGEVGLGAGAHTVRVEYVEYGLEARLAVRWEKIAAVSYPDWKAEYWANPNLQGAPAFTRNEGLPAHNWDLAAPAIGVPADNFSIRWTKTITFEAGLYRFHARADDGVRIRAGAQTVLDEWHLASGDTEYVGQANLSGPQVVVIEYFDSALSARVEVWWEKIPAPAAFVRQAPTESSAPRRQ